MRGLGWRIRCMILMTMMSGVCCACRNDGDAIAHTIVDVNETTQEVLEETAGQEAALKGQAVTLEGEDIPTSVVEETQEEIKSQEVEQQITSITITAVGDVTLGTHQEQDYYASFRQVYDQAEDE